VWRSPVEYAARSKAGIAAGLSDARAGRLHAPAARDHARRFLFGFTTPFTLLRIAWKDPPTRASLVDRLTIPVVLMALALAIGVGSLARDLVASRHHPAALAMEVDRDDDDRDLAHGSAYAHADEPTRAAPQPGRVEVLRTLGRFVESRLAKIILMLGVLEWILVWIIREHHDVVALQVSRLTGVPAEALPAPPRLRFDFGWLKLKAWRALRFLLFMALGSPPAWLLGAIPHVGAALAAAWEAAWAGYWGCVFAVANTFLAWEAPEAGAGGPPGPGTADGAPWFIRALRAAGRIPVVGWPFRLYAALLAKMTRAVWPACIAFERAPWESAGLALARLVAGIPALYLVLRPMFPPAATHTLVARADQAAEATRGAPG
jgi:hypothetical protein